MQKRKDPNGRVLRDGERYRKIADDYSFRWTDKIGKRHEVYAKTLNDFRIKEAEIMRDISEGIRTHDRNITVNDLFNAWREDKKGLRSSTKGNYTYMYEQYVQDSFGKLKIRDVKKSDVRRFYNQLHEAKGLSFNTIEVIQNILNQMFTLAVDDDYTRKSPVSKALGECKQSHNYQRPKRHALTIAEQKAFVEFIKNNSVFSHWLPLFTFLLGTGCRVSEVISLRWKDVDMEEGIISINHGITYYQRETKVCKFQISENTKTEAGTRMIPMLSDVKQAILNEKEYQEEIGIKCLANYNGYTNFIFLNRFGDVHNPETINRTIKRIILAYNIEETEKADAENREPLLLPNFSCHNLRHTFATRYCENERNIKVIQEILGHKDIATTMDVYMEATKDAKKKSFTDLEGKITLM